MASRPTTRTLRRVKTFLSRAAVIVLVACAALACSRVRAVSEEEGAAALLTNLLRAGRVEVFAPGGDVEDACLRAAACVRLERDGLELRVLPQAVAGDPRAARIVLGAPTEPALRELAAALGVVSSGPAAFRWQGFELDDAGDGLVATFQDPARPGLPVTVVLANGRAALALYACGLGNELAPGWRPFARVFRAGRAIAEGALAARRDAGRVRAARRRAARRPAACVRRRRRAAGARGRELPRDPGPRRPAHRGLPRERRTRAPERAGAGPRSTPPRRCRRWP